eukprot:PhF_6_TR677/c0_g1_i2/m.1039
MKRNHPSTDVTPLRGNRCVIFAVPDIMYQVLDYLPGTDFIHMIGVCKFINQYISSEPLLWYRMMKRDYTPRLTPAEELPYETLRIMYRWFHVVSLPPYRQYVEFIEEIDTAPSTLPPLVATTMMLEGRILERTLQLCTFPNAQVVICALLSFHWLAEVNSNVFRSHRCWERGGGLDSLEALQNHENEEVFHSAMSLLQRYFDDVEEEC